MRSLGSKITVLMLMGSTMLWGQVIDALITDAGNQPAIIYKNNGSASFEEVLVQIDQNSNEDARTVVLGDLDGDGDLDAIIGYRSSNSVWLNDGFANFTDTEQALGSENTVTLKLGDLDGDGDLDAVAGNWSGPNKIWINDGQANFTESSQVLGEEEVAEGEPSVAESLDTRALDLGDIDGDGDIDIVLVNVNETDPAQIWINSGSAEFTQAEVSFSTLSYDIFDLTLGDLDGDGDLDIFMTSINDNANLVYFNDGAGVFSDSTQRLGDMRSAYASLGDLDLDGDLDAFVANSDFNCDGANHVWFNDGSGEFESGLFFGNSPSLGVALADFDGDGDLDAVVANRGPDGDANRVWINNGQGVFSDNGQRLGEGRSSAVAVGNLRNLESKSKKRLLLIPEISNEMSLTLFNDTRYPQPMKITPLTVEGQAMDTIIVQLQPSETQTIPLDQITGAASISLSEISPVKAFISSGSHGVIKESDSARQNWSFLESSELEASYQIMNPQVSPATISISNGSLSRMEPITIPPFGSYTLPTQNMFKRGPAQNSMIRIASDIPIVVLSLQQVPDHPELVLPRTSLP